jgi:hypothetical protein
VDEALAPLRRGAGEASLLGLLLVLPVVPSIYAAARGVRLPILPLLVIAGQVSLWLAYLHGDPS